MSTIYDSTILISSSVSPYNSYTRRSILLSVDSISRCRTLSPAARLPQGACAIRACAPPARPAHHATLFESPGSWNTDLYVQLPIFPKPQDVVCSLTRAFYACFVQIRPPHVDCCEPISQSFNPLDLGSGCQKP